jgi:hypothetical protein
LSVIGFLLDDIGGIDGGHDYAGHSQCDHKFDQGETLVVLFEMQVL